MLKEFKTSTVVWQRLAHIDTELPPDCIQKVLTVRSAFIENVTCNDTIHRCLRDAFFSEPQNPQ